MEARRTAGGEELLYCHVEVQSHRDDAFELRLLQYAYLILDRLGRLLLTSRYRHMEGRVAAILA